MNNDLELRFSTSADFTPINKQVEEFKKSTSKTTIKYNVEIDGTKYKQVFQEIVKYTNDIGQSFETMNRYIKGADGSLVLVDSNVVKATADFNKFNQSINTTANVTTKYSDAMGAIVTKTVAVNQNQEQIVTTTREFADATGWVTKEIKVENETLGKTISNHKELIKDTIALADAEKKRKQSMADTGKTTTTTQQMINGYKTLVTTEVELTKTGEQLTTVTKEFTNAEGYAVVEVQKFNQAGEQIEGTIRNMTKNTVKMGQSFADCAVKVAKFYLASLPIQATMTMINEAKDAIFDFDASLTEFKKVSDLSGQALDDYTKKLGELGESVARTRAEMVDASTEFKKSGFSDEESAKLAQIASMYQNVADSELTAGDSATFLISQMKAFNIEAENSIHIIDAVNNVSNNMAVSSTDISMALGKTSSAMGALGNSYEETIGLVTAGTEIMQGQASKVARGLRTIGNNIANTATKAGELEFKVGGVTKSIDLFDKTTGDMKSTYQVMQEISKSWDKMSNAEKQALGITLSGKNQFEVFTAVLSNFEDAQKGVELATNSTGSAIKENERYMDSLQARMQKLKTTFQNFVLGDGGLQNIAKLFLSMTTTVLKVINILGGLRTTLILVSGIIVTMKIESILGTIKGIPSAIKNIVSSLKVMATTASATQIATAGLVATLSLLSIGYGILKSIEAEEKRKEEESIRKKEEKIQALQQESEAIAEIQSSLANEGLSREDLASIISNSTLKSYESELNAIDDVNERRKKAIELINEEAKAKAQEIKDTGFTKYIQAKETLEEGGATRPLNFQMDTSSYDYQNLLEAFRASGWGEEIAGSNGLVTITATTLDDYISKMETVVSVLQSSDEATGKYNKTLSDFEGKLSEAKTSQLEAKDVVEQYEHSLSILGYRYDENSEKLVYDENLVQLQNKAQQQLSDTYQMTDEEIQEYAEDMGMTVEEAKEYLGITEEQGESLEKLTEKYESLIGSMSDISDNYDTMVGAIKEYNSNAGLSFETLEKLLSLNDSYLSTLEFQGDKLVLNTEAYQALANAQIDEAEMTAYSTAMTELQTGATNAYINANYGAVDSANASVQANSQIIQSTQEAVKQAVSGANAWRTYWSAVANSAITSGTVTVEQANAIGKSLQQKLKILEGARKSIKSYTGAVKKSTKASKGHAGATKKANDKLKEQQSILKELVSDYKKVIDYINDKIDDYIDKLEKARDAEVDTIQDQIDALEDQRDAEEDFWNAKLDALEAENDALEDQIEYQELLGALAEAQSKKVKVYREGQGYVYESDENAVNEARRNIEEYRRKKRLEEERKELEDQRDAKIKIYEQQIKDLEDYIKKIEAKYNDQIDYYKKWKEKFKEQVDAYDTEQNRLKALQLTGIDFEKNNWQTRINNLKDFVEQYTKYQKQLAEVNTKVSSSTAGGGGGGGSYSGGAGGGAYGGNYSGSGDYEDIVPQKPYYVYEIIAGYSGKDALNKARTAKANYVKDKKLNARLQQFVRVQQINGQYQVLRFIPTDSKASNITPKTVISYTDATQAKNRASSLQKYGKNQKFSYWNGFSFASGVANVGEDQWAITGENPNKEIVIGSKLNNGVMTKLKKGYGVVNAGSTSTLAGLLNQLGQYSQSGFGAINSTLNNNSSTNKSTNVTIGNISLPNVSDGKGFVDYLQNFNLDMLQKAY